MAAVAAISVGCDTRQLARTTTRQTTMEGNETPPSLSKTCSSASIIPLLVRKSDEVREDHPSEHLEKSSKVKLRAGKEPLPRSPQQCFNAHEDGTGSSSGIESFFAHTCIDDHADDPGESASDTEVVVMVDGTDDNATTSYTKTKRLPMQGTVLARSLSGSPPPSMYSTSTTGSGMKPAHSTSSLHTLQMQDCTQSKVDLTKKTAIGFFPGVVRASRWQKRSVDTSASNIEVMPESKSQSSSGSILRSASEDDERDGPRACAQHTPRTWGRGGKGHRRIRSDGGPMIPSIGMPIKIGESSQDLAPSTCVSSGPATRSGARSSDATGRGRRVSSDRGWKARSTGGLIVAATRDGISATAEEEDAQMVTGLLPPMPKPLRRRGGHGGGHRRHRSYGSLDEISIDVSELSTATTPSVMTFSNASATLDGNVGVPTEKVAGTDALDKTGTMGIGNS
eukprot:m.365227 g.365227  ORF g.365227 m.365227 type:complete len:452 (+) comp20813_c0_seq2:322-1677(+)